MVSLHLGTCGPEFTRSVVRVQIILAVFSLDAKAAQPHSSPVCLRSVSNPVWGQLAVRVYRDRVVRVICLDMTPANHCKSS